MALLVPFAVTRGSVDVNLGARGERRGVTRRSLAGRLGIAIIAAITFTLLSGIVPVFAGRGTTPPPTGSCSQSFSSTGGAVQCSDYMSGSGNPPANNVPSPTPAACVDASWTDYEPATIDYQLPAGQGDWLTGLQLTTTNPVTGGSYTIPDESQVIPVSSAYFVDASWRVTETIGGTAANPTCKLTAAYSGGVGYYPVPVPCVGYGNCASTPWSTFNSIENEIRVSWAPTTPVSSPPAGAITVWVPTTFTSSVDVNGKYLPPSGEVLSTKHKSLSQSGMYGRQLNIMIQISVVPVGTEWRYAASGGQSGTGFTCQFYAGYPTASAVYNQTCSPANDPDVGVFNPSGSGYIFTHDAVKFTIRSRTLVQVQATAYFYTTQQNVEHLASARVWTKWSPTETSNVQQVEGVTQP